ncbi:ScyD/ScyE family protein [Angustibacter luteus]|uniref:ScyD/ScyE family protein n=1 Tax=Angustibacter luteus TaxID=658456 RepID=A0ABW1JCZ6_9ACTN
MARRLLIGSTTLAAAAALVLATPGAASAHSHSHGPTVTVLNSTVGAPFQLAYRHGLVVADGATSTVSRVNGPVLAHGPTPGEVAGVAFAPDGAMAYTSLDYTNGNATLTITRQGKAPVVADLSGFEASHNPDQNVTYGVDNPSQCVQDAFEPLGGATSQGGVDSHAYSVTSWLFGSWIVADAGGNDLLKVDRWGHVSLLKVLPRQPLVVTADIAAGLGLPDCVVGVTYNFEPVPTDVEVGPWGHLYVSLLPGGPEGPQLGARGSVYTVNPFTRSTHRVATGFLGATNVAVDHRGTVYVAELFGGQISTIQHGKVKPYVQLPGALAVELAGDKLFASTLGPTDEEGNPTGPGSVVRINR